MKRLRGSEMEKIGIGWLGLGKRIAYDPSRQNNCQSQDTSELAVLKAENERLRARIAELEGK